ncbi:MAG: COX15/CtaA family protein [Planctomycetota bacterium]
MKDKKGQLESRWPHRIGVLLVMVVFPLIWVGGLVTSYDAGMAVPDWPNTYGYNMLAYPIETWLTGPFDLFVEHGHRLLGMVAGFVSIALVVVTWRNEARKWVCWFSVALLMLVIFQGMLGGTRVLQNARWIAKIHGCVGPAFFATAVAFCVVTSRWWRNNDRRTMLDKAMNLGKIEAGEKPLLLSRKSGALRMVIQWPVLLLVVSYGQLVIGAFLRHIDISAPPEVYKWLIVAHITTAILIVFGTLIQWVVVRTGLVRFAAGLRGTSNLLVLTIAVQFLLGLATWVLKYGWPVWFENIPATAAFVVPEKTFWQMNLITAHVATGSLILAFWTVHMLRYNRVRFGLEVRQQTDQIMADEAMDPRTIPEDSEQTVVQV